MEHVIDTVGQRMMAKFPRLDMKKLLVARIGFRCRERVLSRDPAVVGLANSI